MSLSNGQEAGITRHNNRANLELWISIVSSFCRIGKSKSKLCVFMLNSLDITNLMMREIRGCSTHYSVKKKPLYLKYRKALTKLYKRSEVFWGIMFSTHLDKMVLPIRVLS